VDALIATHSRPNTDSFTGAELAPELDVVESRLRSTGGLIQTRLAVAMAVALLCGAAPATATATAHIRSTTGYSKIRQQGATVHYVLGVEYQPLAFAAGLGEPGTPAERDQRLRDAAPRSRPTSRRG
jgi:hypothetical protein